jgi:outer membrane protein assembly factor BamB
MKTLKHISLLFFILSFINANAQSVKHESLTKLWTSKDGLKTPESALVDTKSGIIYVANVNEKPWEKDGNGFISKLSLTGDILSLEWVKGLNGPKGMGISKGKLYVTDITEVAEIDLKSGQILNKYTHEKAQNLNDITVGDDGTVYISDSKGNCLYKIAGKQLEIVTEFETGVKTNGLFYEKGKLLLGYANSLASLDLKTKKVSTLVDNTGYIDGIEAVGDGSYLISDWAGHINVVKPGSPNLLILDSTSEKINAADIEFDPTSKILYVPTFFDNHIVAYQLKK